MKPYEKTPFLACERWSIMNFILLLPFFTCILCNFGSNQEQCENLEIMCNLLGHFFRYQASRWDVKRENQTNDDM